MLSINQTNDGVIAYPPHRHGHYEIMTYIEGEGYMRTEMGDFRFTKGSIVVIPPSVLHGSRSEKGFKNISIGGDFEDIFMLSAPVAVQDNERGEGQQIAKLLLASGGIDGYYKESLAQAFALFVLERMRLHAPIDGAVERILLQIKKQAFLPEVKVVDILKASGYAEDYIRNQFTKLVGIPPIAYLTRLRMERAKYLIDVYGDSRSLGEIAETCGYTDYLYFSKKFKSAVGVSPKNYLRSSTKDR